MSHSVIAAHLRGTSNGFWRVCRVNSRQPVQYGVQGCQTYNDPHMCTCSDAHSMSIPEPQWVTRSGGRAANAQGAAGCLRIGHMRPQSLSLSAMCTLCNKHHGYQSARCFSSSQRVWAAHRREGTCRAAGRRAVRTVGMRWRRLVRNHILEGIRAFASPGRVRSLKARGSRQGVRASGLAPLNSTRIGP